MPPHAPFTLIQPHSPPCTPSQRVEDWTAADIWSLGCTVVELATGRPPYADEFGDQTTVLYKIGSERRAPRAPSSLGRAGLSFLAACFAPRPRDRPTARQLLKHPFVTGRDGGCKGRRGEEWRRRSMPVPHTPAMAPVPTRAAAVTADESLQQARAAILRKQELWQQQQQEEEVGSKGDDGDLCGISASRALLPGGVPSPPVTTASPRVRVSAASSPAATAPAASAVTATAVSTAGLAGPPSVCAGALVGPITVIRPAGAGNSAQATRLLPVLPESPRRARPRAAILRSMWEKEASLRRGVRGKS